MTLEKSDVEKIAHLARLALDQGDLEALAGELSAILALVEQMGAADTSDCTPMAHPMELGARLRPDEVTESDQRDKFQEIAPRVENGLYLVPRVIE